MQINLSRRLTIVLLGVALVSHPVVAAKVENFKDDQGILHVTNGKKEESAKPSKPVTPMQQYRRPGRSAPEGPLVIAPTPHPQTQAAASPQPGASPPPEEVPPLIINTSPPEGGEPQEEESETPPVMESQPVTSGWQGPVRGRH